MNIITDT